MRNNQSYYNGSSKGENCYPNPPVQRLPFVFPYKVWAVNLSAQSVVETKNAALKKYLK